MSKNKRKTKLQTLERTITTVQHYRLLTPEDQELTLEQETHTSVEYQQEVPK